VAVRHIVGRLYRTRGEAEAAIAPTRDAVDYCRKAGFLPELAWSCHDLADTLLECGSDSAAAVAEGLEVARRLEVLATIADGLTNQEIAEKLFISPKTVAAHLRNIYEKIGAANRAEATAYAVRNGLNER
jgi:DNA-binding NarL/FixJ family response regulator